MQDLTQEKTGGLTKTKCPPKDGQKICEGTHGLIILKEFQDKLDWKDNLYQRPS